MNKHEAAVRGVYPRAAIERQKTNGGQVYYLVRSTWDAGSYLASGETKAQAWAKAAKAVAQ